MFCDYCGAELLDGTRICVMCGMPTNGEAQQPPRLRTDSSIVMPVQRAGKHFWRDDYPRNESRDNPRNGSRDTPLASSQQASSLMDFYEDPTPDEDWLTEIDPASAPRLSKNRPQESSRNDMWQEFDHKWHEADDDTWINRKRDERKSQRQSLPQELEDDSLAAAKTTLINTADTALDPDATGNLNRRPRQARPQGQAGPQAPSDAQADAQKRHATIFDDGAIDIHDAFGTPREFDDSPAPTAPDQFAADGFAALAAPDPFSAPDPFAADGFAALAAPDPFSAPDPFAADGFAALAAPDPFSAPDPFAADGFATLAANDPFAAPDPFAFHEDDPDDAEVIEGVAGDDFEPPKKSFLTDLEMMDPKKKITAIAIGLAAILVCSSALAYALLSSSPYDEDLVARAKARSEEISLAKAEAEAKTIEYEVVLPVDAPGLDENGSRIPVIVTGTQSSGDEYQATGYISHEGKGLALCPGEYLVTVTESPISVEGALYNIPPSPIKVLISDQGDISFDPQNAMLSLTPIDQASITDDHIDRAKAQIEKDLEKVDIAELLAAVARERRDAAIEAKEAQEAAASQPSQTTQESSNNADQASNNSTAENNQANTNNDSQNAQNANQGNGTTENTDNNSANNNNNNNSSEDNGNSGDEGENGEGEGEGGSGTTVDDDSDEIFEIE